MQNVCGELASVNEEAFKNNIANSLFFKNLCFAIIKIMRLNMAVFNARGRM